MQSFEGSYRQRFHSVAGDADVCMSAHEVAIGVEVFTIQVSYILYKLTTRYYIIYQLTCSAAFTYAGFYSATISPVKTISAYSAFSYEPYGIGYKIYYANPNLPWQESFDDANSSFLTSCCQEGMDPFGEASAAVTANSVSAMATYMRAPTQITSTTNLTPKVQ